jgi:hypothetical protein
MGKTMSEYKIESSKQGELPYTVVLDGPEGNTCECKAFEFSTQSPPTCKHIKTATAQRDEAATEDADREMGTD